MRTSRLLPAPPQPPTRWCARCRRREPSDARSAAGATTAEYLIIAGLLVVTLLAVFQIFETQTRAAADRLGKCVAGAAGGSDCTAGGGFWGGVSRGAQVVSRTTSQYWDAVNSGARRLSSATSRYWNALNRGVRAATNTTTRYWNAIDRGVQSVNRTATRYWNSNRERRAVHEPHRHPLLECHATGREPVHGRRRRRFGQQRERRAARGESVGEQATSGHPVACRCRRGPRCKNRLPAE